MRRDIVEALIKRVEQLPYHQFMGFNVSKWDDGYCELTLPMNPNVRNIYGAVHGGIFYSVCDVAAFIAIFPLLPEDTLAVTSDINVSVLQAVQDGPVRFCATVLKMGKRMCFIESKAFDENDNLVVTARITKSLVHYPQMKEVLKEVEEQTS